MNGMLLTSTLAMATVVRLIPYQIGSIIYTIVNFYIFIIFAWAVLSWFRRSSGPVDDIYKGLGKVVEPFVGLFKKFIRPAGGVDFSPFIAIIVLQVVVRLLISL